MLAHPGQVDVRIAAKARNAEAAARLIDPVEAEVRGLLGRHVFAVDEETMEDAVGREMAGAGATIAVYEDLTSGLVAERLLEAGPERFVEGVTGNPSAGSGQAPRDAVRRLLAHSRRPEDAEALLWDAEGLADELAWAVRSRSGADLGLAVHGVQDPADTAENLARGRTVLSITDGSGFRRRSYNMAGRGRPDRTRMSLNAIELVRAALVEGFSGC